MNGSLPYENWEGKMLCLETDASITFRANKTQGFIAAYTFTLVIEGWLRLVYNGHEICLHADDLYIYSSGFPVTILQASDDYRGICLLADEIMTIDSPMVRDLVHIAYRPFVQLHEPLLHLPRHLAEQLADKMREIIIYLNSDYIYKEKMLSMLYAVFLLELQNAQELTISTRQVSQRVEEIFFGFMRLLPKHFQEHHDIGFYASRLNISPVYLSRIVRQVAGCSVLDYIKQILVMEAAFLLDNTQLSIAQIAQCLYFADTTSFSKFFSRLKGVSPHQYRNQN